MNIIDYMKWRGDITLDVDPFNEVDNLILSYIIYTDFDELIGEGEKLTVKTLSDRYFKSEKSKKKDLSFIADSKDVLKAAGECERFKNAVIRNFISKFDEKTTQQFCAMMLRLDDRSTYVAFRGTDDTLIGWKEDFMLSYDEIPAQKSAIDYLNQYGRGVKDLRVGGHSKGGNLAIVSSLKCNRNIQKNIINIYSNDGPGIGPILFDEDQFNLIKDRYVKIVPENDIVGAIYDYGNEKKIVLSSDKSFMSHSGMTWQVERNRFLTTDKTTVQSQTIRDDITDFLENTNKKQKMIFVDEFFRALKEANYSNISDIITGGVPAVVNSLIHLSKMDESAKEVANRLIKVIVNSYSKELDSFIDKSKSSILGVTSGIGKTVKNTIDEVGTFVKDYLNNNIHK